MLSDSSSSAGNSLSDAGSISLGTTYSGSMTETNEQDYYKFTLSGSGTITLTSTAYMRRLNYKIFDSDGNQLWYSNELWNTSTEQIVLEQVLCLTSGVYYLAMEKNGYTGSYYFRIAYTSANESIQETNGGTNNTLTTANTISLGKTYNGQIALNDDKDCYQFTLPTSGTVTLTSTAYMYRVYYRIFDSDGNQLWYSNSYWNSSTEQIVLEQVLCLTSGVYYLELEKGGYTGNYSFQVAFASAGESFSETNGGSDNSIAAANSITLNTTYKGQIALNDDRDFYQFTITTSGDIQLTSTAYMYRVYYRIFDSSGNQLWYSYDRWNESTQTITLDKTISLDAGTYYLELERYDTDYTGNYSFHINYALNTCVISGLTNTAKGIQLEWNKIANANGYYVYRKSGSGSYKKIKTIQSASTVSYTDTSVKSKNGTQYTYKVIPYADGVEGTFTEKTIVRLTGTTLSGLKNSASKEIVVKWKKATKVTGYEIQYSTKKNFSGTTTKTVKVSGAKNVRKTLTAGLKKKKTYYVRIRTYKTVSGETYYSAWSAKKNIKVTK